MRKRQLGLLALLVSVISGLLILAWSVTQDSTAAQGGAVRNADSETGGAVETRTIPHARGLRFSAEPVRERRMPYSAEEIEIERREIHDRLARSGTTSESWATTAASMLQKWRSTAPEWVRSATKESAVECYHDGCMMLVTYDSMARSLDALDEIGKALQEWPGGRIHTAIQPTESGKAVSAFILLPPPADQVLGR